jgi:hypothetical protein
LTNGLVSDDWVFLYFVWGAPTLRQAMQFFNFGYQSYWFVRPVEWLATWVLYKASGTNPVAYHLASVLLNLADGVLFGVLAYWLIERSSTNRRRSLVASIAAFALFVFNWRHHEAVFWYSSINELFSALFRLAALLLLIYAFESQGRKGKRWIAYLCSLAIYALALLSKESSVVFPAEMLLLLLCVRLMAGELFGKQILVRLAAWAPFLALTVVWGIEYAATSDSQSSAIVARSGHTLITNAPIRDMLLHFLQYLNGNLIGLGALASSPAALSFELVALAAIAVLALVRRQYLWVFALLWSLAAVAPYALMAGESYVQQRQPILALGIEGDRYLYYSAAGFALLLVMSALWIADEASRLVGPERGRWVMGLAGLGFAVLLSLNVHMLVLQGAQWRTAGAISNHILTTILTRVPKPKPNSIVCLRNLPDSYEGKYIFRNGVEGALAVAWSTYDVGFKKTVQSSPSSPAPPLDESGCTYVFSYDAKTQSLAFRER